MSYRRSVNFELEMIVIPAGEFLMGCATGAANERPAHRVWVDRFAVGRSAVTNRLYRAFLEWTGRQDPPGFSDARFNHPDQPVTSVSWFDGAAYCAWLSERAGKAYRLPTEAEWERAARGGLEAKLYTWGDEPPQTQPRYAELWGAGPERVGRRPPNGFGLYDISETFTSGSLTGTTRTTTGSRRRATRKGRWQACGAPRAAARGVIRSRSPAWPRAAASSRSINTAITGSAAR